MVRRRFKTLGLLAETRGAKAGTYFVASAFISYPIIGKKSHILRAFAKEIGINLVSVAHLDIRIDT